MQTNEVADRLRTWADGLEILKSHAQALMAREAADEIERILAERDQARRQYCRGFTDFCPNPAHNHLGLEAAAIEVAKSFGWDCFKKNKS
jgi:hypothetical protein